MSCVAWRTDVDQGGREQRDAIGRTVAKKPAASPGERQQRSENSAATTKGRCSAIVELLPFARNGPKRDVCWLMGFFPSTPARRSYNSFTFCHRFLKFYILCCVDDMP